MSHDERLAVSTDIFGTSVEIFYPPPPDLVPLKKGIKQDGHTLD